MTNCLCLIIQFKKKGYYSNEVSAFKQTVGNVLPVTGWLILSSAYKSYQSMMVSHRAINCTVETHQST